MAVTDQELAQALTNMEGQQRQLILTRAADLVLDRHINDSPISDAQIREYFPGKTDAEIANAAQGFLDDMYNYHDGDIGRAITVLTSENNVSATQPPSPPVSEPEASPPAETEAAAGPEPESKTVVESDLSRSSLEAISSYEGFSQNVRDSAQKILEVADQEHDGDVSLAVASLRGEENTPEMAAVLNGDVEVSTTPLFDRETFRNAFEEVQPSEPLSSDQDALLRESYQGALASVETLSQSLPGAGNTTSVLLTQIMNYADTEHGGSLSAAANALAEMGPDQAYDTLGMGSFTQVTASAPLEFTVSTQELAPAEVSTTPLLDRETFRNAFEEVQPSEPLSSDEDALLRETYQNAINAEGAGNEGVVLEQVVKYADAEHGGSLSGAVNALNEMGSDKAYDALNMSNVTVPQAGASTFDRETFTNVFEEVQPSEPLSSDEDAMLRETYQNAINAEGAGNEGVVLEQVVKYADAEHGGSLSVAVNALNEMGPDQAYDALNMDTVTVEPVSSPAVPDVSAQETAPAAETTEASASTPDGMTIGEISATLESIPPAMVTRGNLENVAQNGVPAMVENMIGVSSENAQAMAKEALEITDARFDGNLDAAVTFLKTEGQNEQYANLTVSQLSDALESTPEVAQQATAQAATAAGVGASSIMTEEQKARLQNDMTNMFNNVSTAFQEGGLEAGLASMEGLMEQLMTVFQQFFGGASGFSISNDATAFAGAQAPNGFSMPEGTQLNPATGEPVQTAGADNENREVVTDTQILVAGR